MKKKKSQLWCKTFKTVRKNIAKKKKKKTECCSKVMMLGGWGAGWPSGLRPPPLGDLEVLLINPSPTPHSSAGSLLLSPLLLPRLVLPLPLRSQIKK